ncbi:hypothetical protein [Robbsia sp. KACC 23696]|uniref:hypothetical protein n=1 Tax=Robbsia sp. KACC 23696 TaxID=3149231 RepID=UPI00325B0193
MASGLEWVSTVVYFDDGYSPWISIRVSCESHGAATRLPAAKKPFLVRLILNRLKPGKDGSLTVSDKATALTNSEVQFAAQCITGRAHAHLPIVYISAPFVGEQAVDVAQLAQKLSGMAHVVLEPNRAFSLRLMHEVNEENVFGGNIGIYWPGSDGRRSIFSHRQHQTIKLLEKAIYEEVRGALANRRPKFRSTWPSVQELISREKLEQLRASGSSVVAEYIENFDLEMEAKNDQLNDAEREIARLQNEVRILEARAPMQSGLNLNTNTEQDFFEGEIRDVVIDALELSSNSVVEDSRRKHILNAIIKSNAKLNVSETYKEKIKSVFRNYRNMDAKTKAELINMGFSISDEGKHIKICFQDDHRYTFTLPKTGSDHRGGMNMASDINRKLF